MSLYQVKLIHVFLDDAAISPSEGFLIRKGPGNCHFDFAQEILFIDYLQTPTDSKRAEDYHKYAPPPPQLLTSVLFMQILSVVVSKWRRSCKRQEQASMDYEAPIMPCGCILLISLHIINLPSHFSRSFSFLGQNVLH